MDITVTDFKKTGQSCTLFKGIKEPVLVMNNIDLLIVVSDTVVTIPKHGINYNLTFSSIELRNDFADYMDINIFPIA